MAWYRIYIMNSDNLSSSDISAECSDDQEACVFAESLLTPRAQAEVWNGTKLVRVLSLSMAAQ